MDSVILFAKFPVPGRVKTRLCPPLSPEQAAEVYRAMARDCWRAARAAVGKGALVALDPEGGRLDPAWLGRGARAFRQRGADLGARMGAAFSRAFRLGSQRAAVVGSDCPELSAGELRGALRELDRADVVLGPAADGGYYLVALKSPCPGLFRDMAWSRRDVLKKTLARAKTLGLGVSLLRRRADIDTYADLKALSRRAVPRYTAAALKTVLGLWLIFSPGRLVGAELVVDRFSAERGERGLPKGWKPLLFKKIPVHTVYTLSRDEEGWFVRSASQGAASGIVKAVPASLKDYPVLSWRWRVEEAPGRGDPERKAGDDYPARVYVGFGSVFPKAINYVWDNRPHAAAEFDNPFTSRAKMVVAGGGPLGAWIEARRNVYEDYKRLFGGEPPRVSFIALMTDSDNAGGRAAAAFDDIVLSHP
jgi:rSAM/selenodomain-associated transferase 1